jgi:hypothetical protein
MGIKNIIGELQVDGVVGASEVHIGGENAVVIDAEGIKVNGNTVISSDGVLDDYIPNSQMGVVNGVATLDASGKISTSQLPSYVDDVLEYTSVSAFPATGEAGKIYVDTTANITYRWGGSSYVEISKSLALGETEATAYRGDRGKTAYDHSQVKSGNPHNVTKSDIGLGNVENKSSATIRSELTKVNVTTALGYTPPESDTVYTHPTSHPAAMITGLATVATSGSYNDLKNKPTIPAAYTLPPAGTSLGGVKSGGDATITDGIITINIEPQEITDTVYTKIFSEMETWTFVLEDGTSVDKKVAINKAT